jgi:hypothetical protein
MIFAGPCSPRFTADTLVVSVNVGEGGPPAPAGEALRFPCAFVVIVKGRRGLDFGIGERGFGRVAAGREGEREREEGLDVQSKPLEEIGASSLWAASSGVPARGGTLRRRATLAELARCKSTSPTNICSRCM